jgi:hypothetical protein
MIVEKDFFDLKTGTKFRKEKGGRAWIVTGKEYLDKAEGIPHRRVFDPAVGRSYPMCTGMVWVEDGKPELPTKKQTVLIKKGGKK